MNAYQKGQVAQQDGVPQDDNPYSLGTRWWWKWREGWENERKWVEDPARAIIENPVDFGKYQEYVAATISPSLDKRRLQWNATAALEDTAKQMVALAHPLLYQGDTDKAQATESISEALWHLGAICVSLGIDMEAAAKHGMTKRVPLEMNK